MSFICWPVWSHLILQKGTWPPEIISLKGTVLFLFIFLFLINIFCFDSFCIILYFMLWFSYLIIHIGKFWYLFQEYIYWLMRSKNGGFLNFYQEKLFPLEVKDSIFFAVEVIWGFLIWLSFQLGVLNFLRGIFWIDFITISRIGFCEVGILFRGKFKGILFNASWLEAIGSQPFSISIDLENADKWIMSSKAKALIIVL